MRFKTSHPDGDCYDGVVVHVGSDFIALREEADFEFDGIQILPKRVVRGYRDGRFDRCCNEILRYNGQIRKAVAPAWLAGCVTVSDVLRHCHKKDIWPGLEVIDLEDGGLFYLGPIAELTTEVVRQKCYDADGRWEKVYEIPYGDIFRVEIGGKYCTHFNSYMKRDPVK